MIPKEDTNIVKQTTEWRWGSIIALTDKMINNIKVLKSTIL